MNESKQRLPHLLALLSHEDLDLITELVLLSGSLKALATAYDVSYPTIRVRLDRVIARLRELRNGQPLDPFSELLAELIDRGEVSAIAAIGGAAMGSLVGLFGTAVGVLASRGKIGMWAVRVQVGFAALGVLILIGGIVALLMHQPYHVYYPLLLLGGILALVCGMCVMPVWSAVQQCERRRLAVAEMRRG